MENYIERTYYNRFVLICTARGEDKDVVQYAVNAYGYLLERMEKLTLPEFAIRISESYDITTPQNKAVFDTLNKYLPMEESLPAVKCFCGANMIPAGYGKYPYDCIAKDKYPNAMVYIGCENGHTCWSLAEVKGGPMPTTNPKEAQRLKQDYQNGLKLIK